ncbi:exported protein STY2149 [Pseudoalteromonas sp. SW0106-04]|uniref:SH3 domain-containing protein n=1 Tax=Pseudoalteromonas sp. SW0106-04 TaxID=1702169 RepID=UPI0006B49963|nr:SH3 domain-containing protein [Pseudoalteromonas sp. SW0106-04]GAP75409.1 exported protein STY2149 [Pseudoalteromonas sp. SW0106-04]
MTKTPVSIVCALVLGCTLGAGHSVAQQSVAQQSNYAPFVSDVPLVQQPMLNPEFWLQRQSDSKPLMSQSQIQAFNRSLINNNPYIIDPLAMPDTLSAKALRSYIRNTSSTPSSPRFYVDGKQLDRADLARYHANTNIDAVTDSNPVRFGLIVERTSLRTFPTADRVLNSEMDADLDRFQETGAFPAEPVAILHESADGQWYLVAAYNYTAWVKRSAVAVGNKNRIRTFTQADDFIVVTGDKIETTYVPNEPRVSEVQLDMGVRLPLAPKEQVKHLTHGQNSFASYIVMLPVRNDDGTLSFAQGLIPRSADVHLGYLPLTAHHLIAQGFKFLGERYGWGHDYNARDCTGFVGEIYKSFGVWMPRNSSWQGKTDYGHNWRFDKDSTEAQKREVIAQMQVGDLIYIPGHVMMYIGSYQGQPYVIHDVKGLGYIQQNGEFYDGELNGVSVTPLLPLHLNSTTSYLERTYAIKRIAQGAEQ